MAEYINDVMFCAKLSHGEHTSHASSHEGVLMCAVCSEPATQRETKLIAMAMTDNHPTKSHLFNSSLTFCDIFVVSFKQSSLEEI